MNIAFLSSLNPSDIHNWSGTLYFMYQKLSESNDVTWIGGNILEEAISYHEKNEELGIPFQPENYSKVFGMMLSSQLQKEYYDLIICRDYFFLSDLQTDIPVIYVGDTTFKLFNEYMQIKNSLEVCRNDTLERKAIEKANYVVYPSTWAKESAIHDYGKDDKHIKVIEFGANLVTVPSKIEHKIDKSCHLLFIGTNWAMKGGEKVLAIHNALLAIGVDSYLTIVGCSLPYKLIDNRITIHPHIDKATREGFVQFDQILQDSHFLIAPTLFDCFGIVNCEASAYGIPILTIDTGGVSQAVKDRVNGFLFKPNSTLTEWVNCICNMLEHPENYQAISKQARKEYELRLNWGKWGQEMNHLINQIVKKTEVYIPTYAINIKERRDRRKHIIAEFNGRDEFDLHLTDACVESDGRKGLWNSIVNIIQKAKKDNEQLVIICEDDHFFTKSYSHHLLMSEIQKAYQLGASILLGGIGGFGTAIPVAFRLYQVDWFWCTQFMVIFSSLFDSILSYQYKDKDTADGILSNIAPRKMVIYPFISEQKDFGYSDVTQSNQEHSGKIREHFIESNQMLCEIEKIYKDSR